MRRRTTKRAVSVLAGKHPSSHLSLPPFRRPHSGRQKSVRQCVRGLAQNGALTSVAHWGPKKKHPTNQPPHHRPGPPAPTSTGSFPCSRESSSASASTWSSWASQTTSPTPTTSIQPQRWRRHSSAGTSPRRCYCPWHRTACTNSWVWRGRAALWVSYVSAWALFRSYSLDLARSWESRVSFVRAWSGRSCQEGSWISIFESAIQNGRLVGLSQGKEGAWKLKGEEREGYTWKQHKALTKSLVR